LHAREIASQFPNPNSLDPALKRYFTGYGPESLVHNSLPDHKNLSFYSIQELKKSKKAQQNISSFLANTKEPSSIYTHREGPEISLGFELTPNYPI
jgi:hypothetical protein